MKKEQIEREVAMRVTKLNTGRQEKHKYKEVETHKALQNVWEVQAGVVKSSVKKGEGIAAIVSEKEKQAICGWGPCLLECISLWLMYGVLSGIWGLDRPQSGLDRVCVMESSLISFAMG